MITREKGLKAFMKLEHEKHKYDVKKYLEFRIRLAPATIKLRAYIVSSPDLPS